jgi:hypothetical protein
MHNRRFPAPWTVEESEPRRRGAGAGHSVQDEEQGQDRMLASVVVSAMDYGSMTHAPRQALAPLPRSPACPHSVGAASALTRIHKRSHLRNSAQKVTGVTPTA